MSLRDTNFFCMDFGSLRDPSAINIMSRGMVPIETNKFRSVYKTRYLDRLPIGMEYPDQVRRVKAMFEHKDIIGKTTLLVDLTTVGLPVYQMMREAGLNPIGVWITAGNYVTQRKEGYNVPKRELVSAMNLVFQSRRLKIPHGLKYRKEFMKELEGFKLTITPGGMDTYEAAVASVHDDLVIATAIGIWYAEKFYGSTYTPLEDTEKGVKEMKDPLEEGL